MIKRIILVLLLTFNPLQGFAQTDCNVSTITVGGNGEEKGKPDIATISVGVVTKGKNAADAVSENAKAVQKLLDTLRSSGIAEKDIQTSSISVYPLYKYNNNNEGTINGYQANNQLIATIRKVSDVGKVIDSISITGDYSINGVSFSIENTDDLESSALELAVSSAKRKADAVAKASGVTIIGVKSINVDSYSGKRFIEGYPTASADAGVPTQVLSGDVSVSANVTVQYLIK